jgi:hypothetical protein
LAASIATQVGATYINIPLQDTSLPVGCSMSYFLIFFFANVHVLYLDYHPTVREHTVWASIEASVVSICGFFSFQIIFILYARSPKSWAGLKQASPHHHPLSTTVTYTFSLTAGQMCTGSRLQFRTMMVRLRKSNSRIVEHTLLGLLRPTKHGGKFTFFYNFLYGLFIKL